MVNRVDRMPSKHLRLSCEDRLLFVSVRHCHFGYVPCCIWSLVLCSLSIFVVWCSEEFKSRESNNCFIYGPQFFFFYTDCLHWVCFAHFLCFIPSLDSTLLSWYDARSHPWCFTQTGFINLQHHEKRRKTIAWKAFKNGICLVCFSSAISFGLWMQYMEMDKWKNTWVKHLLPGRVLISDKIGNQSVLLTFLLLLFLFPFDEDMRNAAWPGGRNAGYKKKKGKKN